MNISVILIIESYFNILAIIPKAILSDSLKFLSSPNFDFDQNR